MNAVMDIGNTRGKVAFFEKNRLLAVHEFLDETLATQILQAGGPIHIIVSNVSNRFRGPLPVEVKGQYLALTPELPIPLRLDYETPQTLGADRIAAACGAAARFPGENCLVIDLGTCINYELVTSDRVYRGGAISPGVQMRFLAMHQQTARLPLAEPIPKAALIGQSTITCLQSGVLNGVVAELTGMIARYEMQCSGKLHVILCGGDAQLFENQLKPPIFVAPNLVLEGLNSILEHNVAA